MSRRKARRKRWAVSVGHKGLNRVRAYESTNGRLYLQWTELGVVHSEPTRTTDRLEARKLAEQKAMLLQGGGTVARKLTLPDLFANYANQTRGKGHRNLAQRVRGFSLMSRFWGDREVSSLRSRDIEAYVKARMSGSLTHHGRTGGVRARAVEEELQGLRAAIRLATVTSDGREGYLLDSNPIRGMVLPKEQHVHRPRLEDGEYSSILENACAVDARFALLLVLCHETGHRLNSVRQLQWSEIDLQASTIRWAASKQKNGIDHTTPLTLAAKEALERFQAADPIKSDYLFASARGVAPVGREQCYKWWKMGREAAGLPPKPRGAFHMFRRELASALSTAPLAVVKELLGSKNPAVLVSVYQQPNIDQLRAVLHDRDRYATGQVSSER